MSLFISLFGSSVLLCVTIGDRTCLIRIHCGTPVERGRLLKVVLRSTALSAVTCTYFEFSVKEIRAVHWRNYFVI